MCRLKVWLLVLALLVPKLFKAAFPEQNLIAINHHNRQSVAFTLSFMIP